MDNLSSPVAFIISFFKKLYWNRAHLQCCVSFRCIARWFSYAYTHLLIFNYFRIQVITEYWVEFHALCSRSFLVICLIYSRVCVLNPTWFIPPRHVSPLVTISLFLNSVSLFLFCKSMCVCHAQSCSTLCNPMYCSLPGCSVHGIFQVKTLEGVVISSSRGSSQPRDQTLDSYISYIGRQVLYQ